MRLVLLIFALGIALGSLLTIVRAPDYMWAWKLAILVTEFGPWLMILPLAFAVLAGFGCSGAWRIAFLMLCLAGIPALARPVCAACGLARTLRERLGAAFGIKVAGFELSWRRLY